MTHGHPRHRYSAPDLNRFFEPSVVAVVGATDENGRQSTYAWRQLRSWGARAGARVVPVHPHRPSVDGFPTAAELAEIEEPIDVVAVLVADALPVVRAAAKVEAGFVVVFAAGFAETGNAGRHRQHQLRAALGDGPTRLIGPNTNLNAFEPLDDSLPAPGLALLSQSGHQGRPLYLLQRAGVRITHWAPTGNEADIDAADLLAWFATRPDVGAVAAYLEGIADGRRFLVAADAARAAGVPVVAVKVGRSDTGASAALSHTGALTGSDRVTDAAFRSAGVVRVDDLDDLADTSTFLLRAPAPAAPGVAVYAMSGGTCSLLADQLAVAGVAVPRLGTATRSGLRDLVAGFLPVGNPVDCGGPPMGDNRGRRILELLAADSAVGCVIAAVTGPVPPFTDRLVDDLRTVAAARPDISFVLAWGSPHVADPRLDDAVRDPNVAVFRSGRAAVTAISSWQRWHDGPRAATRRGASRSRSDLRHLDWPRIEDASEWRSRDFLAAAGVALAPAVLVHSAAEAGRVVGDLGGTVVMKADVAGLAHRARHGLVAGSVTSSSAGRRTATRLLAQAEKVAPGRVRGLVVAAQAPPGPEVLVGALCDPSFGTVVTVGHGGGDVELVAQTAIGLAPLRVRDAARLLDEVHGSSAWRAVGRASWEGLCHAVVAIGDLAHAAGPELGAIECNPLRLLPEGVCALDAWAYAAGPSGSTEQA